LLLRNKNGDVTFQRAVVFYHTSVHIIRVCQTIPPPHPLSPVLPTVRQFSESCPADWRTALA